MADAADETVLATRYMDDVEVDLTLIPAEIEMWDKRTHFLFCEEGCVRYGYREYALKEIANTRVIPILGKAIWWNPQTHLATLHEAYAMMEGSRAGCDARRIS